MKLRLTRLASGLCSLLCIAVAVMWVRSYWDSDWVSWSRAPVYLSVLSAGGCIEFEAAGRVQRSDGLWTGHQEFEAANDVTFRIICHELHPAGDQLDIDTENDCDWNGFGYLQGSYDFLSTGESRSSESPMMGSHAPDWAIALLSGALPGWRFIRSRRRLRSADGMCRACGYDLRATPHRCPECGSEVQKNIHASAERWHGDVV